MKDYENAVFKTIHLWVENAKANPLLKRMFDVEKAEMDQDCWVQMGDQFRFVQLTLFLEDNQGSDELRFNAAKMRNALQENALKSVPSEDEEAFVAMNRAANQALKAAKGANLSEEEMVALEVGVQLLRIADGLFYSNSAA